MKGILLVDKPVRLTSHDVVNRIRRASGIRRVGHTGTLDPAATGLLILCLGPATRLSEFLTGLDKVYEGAMQLGIVTDSYDLDGAVMAEQPIPELTSADLQQAFDRFTGEIMQVPPMVSAVKVGGERLYKRARKGETVAREARRVRVEEFRLLQYEPPLAHFRLRCTRGTYARSLCHDVGQHLGCGATLAMLRRTWVGSHSVENALPVDAFATPQDVASRLLPLEKALDLPEIRVRRTSLKALNSGANVLPRDILGQCPTEPGWIQIKAESGDLLALGVVERGDFGLRIRPKRVLAAEP